MCIYIYTRDAHIYIYINIYIHTRCVIYIYTHTHTYVHRHVLGSFWVSKVSKYYKTQVAKRCNLVEKLISNLAGSIPLNLSQDFSEKKTDVPLYSWIRRTNLLLQQSLLLKNLTHPVPFATIPKEMTSAKTWRALRSSNWTGKLAAGLGQQFFFDRKIVPPK